MGQTKGSGLSFFPLGQRKDLPPEVYILTEPLKEALIKAASCIGNIVLLITMTTKGTDINITPTKNNPHPFSMKLIF
ncbi:hypothetical protein FOLKNPGA_00852 [Legionella sp. PC1000]|nr:hypothetical protein FOLKNPGA_00852 [Legionella sp. PC1000]